jgi:hypothetical protein
LSVFQGVLIRQILLFVIINFITKYNIGYLIRATDGQRESTFKRLLKNAHLLRFPHPSSLRRTSKYASLLRISGALHLAIFEQPLKDDFFKIP